MAAFLDSVPVSGIIRIRDMMYTVDKPFRLDQGDVSFDAPPSVKEAMLKAVHDNRTHYLPTNGVPRLLELLVEKLLANGANPNATNKKKVTALAIAKARKHPDIVAALEKAGARR